MSFSKFLEVRQGLFLFRVLRLGHFWDSLMYGDRTYRTTEMRDGTYRNKDNIIVLRFVVQGRYGLLSEMI